jgi:hypothetical protein
MLTPQEIQFLYQLLDQVNLRGEDNKLMALTIMAKLRIASEPKKEEEDD